MEHSLQTLNAQQRAALWAQRITACRTSELTVRAWCQENNLSEKTYYYWQRRVFGVVSGQQSAFAEITPARGSCPSGDIAVTIRVSGAEADIHSGADPAVVETVLRFLKSC